MQCTGGATPGTIVAPETTQPEDVKHLLCFFRIVFGVSWPFSHRNVLAEANYDHNQKL